MDAACCFGHGGSASKTSLTCQKSYSRFGEGFKVIQFVFNSS